MEKKAARSILVAIDSRFWLEDRGSRVRTASLLRNLQGHGLAVWVYFAGQLEQSDRDALQAGYPGLSVYTPGSADQLQKEGFAPFWAGWDALRSTVNWVGTGIRGRVGSISRKLLKSHTPAWLRYLDEDHLADFYARSIQEPFRRLGRAKL